MDTTDKEIYVGGLLMDNKNKTPSHCMLKKCRFWDGSFPCDNSFCSYAYSEMMEVIDIPSKAIDIVAISADNKRKSLDKLKPIFITYRLEK